ncbi:MAG TPA: tetratricopeptide repeat protein, partial [Bacteroidia bacterium]
MKGSRKIFFRFLYLDKTTRKSLWFIACLLTLSVLTAQNNTKLDSLYRIYNASAEDTNKVQILNEICKEYQKGDGAQLLKNAETMLNLSIRLKYLKGQAQAYHHLSAYYEYSEDLNKALHYELLNYQINTKRGDSLLISKSYHNIGWLYECLGQHNKALEYCYKKIYILNKIKPSDFKKRALPTYEIMGLIFKSIKIHDSAIYYLDLSHKLAIEESDVRALSSVLVNKGIIYEETKDYSKAEKLYLQATKVAIEGSFTNNLSGAYQGLAGVYLHTGKYNLAIEYANKALDIAIPSGHKLWELYCYEVLEKAHKENNDFKN